MVTIPYRTISNTCSSNISEFIIKLKCKSSFHLWLHCYFPFQNTKNKKNDMTLTKNFMICKLDSTPGPRFLTTTHRFAGRWTYCVLDYLKALLTLWNEKGSWWVGKNFEGSSHVTVICLVCASPWKTPVKITNAMNDIQNEHLQSKAMAHYHHISPLGLKEEVLKFLYVWVMQLFRVS